MGKRIVLAGDVFSGTVSDGRYAAVKVITVSEDGTPLVACTEYLDSVPPKLSDERLRSVLSRRRFSFKGEPAVFWVEGGSPDLLAHVGNIQVTKAETSIDPRGSTRNAWETVLNEVLLEWRWKHERVVLESEISTQQMYDEIAQAEKHNRMLGPRRPIKGARLSDQQFWQLIAELNPSSMNSLVEKLSKLEVADILEFQELLTEKLYQLDQIEFIQNSGAAAESADGFLYARCYVVGNGKEYFESVRSHPELFPKDVEFEDLLYIAQQAYTKKTGKPFVHTTHYSYETGAGSAPEP